MIDCHARCPVLFPVLLCSASCPVPCLVPWPVLSYPLRTKVPKYKFSLRQKINPALPREKAIALENCHLVSSLITLGQISSSRGPGSQRPHTTPHTNLHTTHTRHQAPLHTRPHHTLPDHTTPRHTTPHHTTPKQLYQVLYISSYE